MMHRYWALVAGALILVVAGLAHGWRTDRWGESAGLVAAAARLNEIPLRVGDWEGVVVELPPEQIKAAHVAGLISMRYTHKYTRESASVLILCGRPGPVSVHTPDICYTANGFVMGEERQEPLADGQNAWVANFIRGRATPETLRIRWAWSTGGDWLAAKSPRTEFARARLLYKIYVVYSVSAGRDKTDGPPELALMKELLPKIQSSLSLSQ